MGCLYRGMDLKIALQEKKVINSSKFVCGILRMLLENYEKLSPVLKAEIPLKQIWILSEEE